MCFNLSHRSLQDLAAAACSCTQLASLTRSDPSVAAPWLVAKCEAVIPGALACRCAAIEQLQCCLATRVLGRTDVYGGDTMTPDQLKEWGELLEHTEREVC